MRNDKDIQRRGFLAGAYGKESSCQCRRHLGKIPWSWKWHTTPVFLPGESHGQYEKQKDMILKDELPRSVGAQYATGEMTPERMKRRSEGAHV